MAISPDDNSDLLLRHFEKELDLFLAAHVHNKPLELVFRKYEPIFSILGDQHDAHPIFEKIVELYKAAGWEVYQTYYNLVFKK